jgi:hypothetical protein
MGSQKNRRDASAVPPAAAKIPLVERIEAAAVAAVLLTVRVAVTAVVPVIAGGADTLHVGGF